MSRIAQTIAATALVSSIASTALAADALKLAIGQRGKWDGAVAELGMRAGIFKTYGIDLEILWSSGGGGTMQAGISSRVDIGMGARTRRGLGALSKRAPNRHKRVRGVREER